jgi:hypothetical protein
MKNITQINQSGSYDHLCKTDKRHVLSLYNRKCWLEKKTKESGCGYIHAELSSIDFALKYIRTARGYPYEIKPTEKDLT